MKIIKVDKGEEEIFYLSWSPNGIDECKIYETAQERKLPLIIIGPSATGKTTFSKVMTMKYYGKSPIYLGTSFDSMDSTINMDNLKNKDEGYVILNISRVYDIDISWDKFEKTMEILVSNIIEKKINLVAIELTVPEKYIDFYDNIRIFSNKKNIPLLEMTKLPVDVDVKLAKIDNGVPHDYLGIEVQQ